MKPLLDPLSTHLRAMELLEVGFATADPEELWPALKADLEVLPREDLIRVAMALAYEATRMVPAKCREECRSRLGRRRMSTELRKQWDDEWGIG